MEAMKGCVDALCMYWECEERRDYRRVFTAYMQIELGFDSHLMLKMKKQISVWGLIKNLMQTEGLLLYMNKIHFFKR